MLYAEQAVDRKNKQYLSVQVEDAGELFVLQVGANQKSNIPPKGSVSRKQVEPNTGKCVVLLC